MGNPQSGSRREGRGRFIHSDSDPGPAIPHLSPLPTPLSMPSPLPSPSKPKSTRRAPPAKDGTGRTPRANAPPAPKKDNTMLIVGGVAGGIFLLVVLIAVAASSGNKPRPVEKKKEAPVAVAEPEKSTATKQDTGPITFACLGNGGKHPEKESSVTRCPKCSARSRFYWDYKNNKFSCFDCKALFEKADIKCPDCGGTPNRDPFIKHRPG